MSTRAQSDIYLPRVEIKFCVKCKWNLRAAYYAQELLQTFCSPPSEITLGEVSLVPVSGGIFTITLYHASQTTNTIVAAADDETATPPPRSQTEPISLPSNSSNDDGGNSNLTKTSSGIAHTDNGPIPLPLTNSTATTSDPTAESTISASPTLVSKAPKAESADTVTAIQIWDRKADGGFPETKELKNRIRNLIDPARDMGHIDRSLNKGGTVSTTAADAVDQPRTGRDSKAGDNEDGVGKRGEQGSGNDKEAPESRGKEKPEETITQEECEECRLAARESLEDQLGRINSRSRPHPH